jgi:hypothetical protein
MARLRLIRSLLVGIVFLVGLQAQAQQIIVGGDITGATVGVAVSAPGTNNTQPFSLASGGNTITGDVIVANNVLGDSFTLTMTNLVLTSVAPNPGGTLDVFVEVLHNYVPGTPGPFMGNQSVSGSWVGGPLTTLQLETLLDVGGANVYLPSILIDLPTQNPTFTAGPNPGIVPATPSNPFQINSILRMRIDGVGNISLPSSVDISVAVPEPTAATLLAVGAVAMFGRRR